MVLDSVYRQTMKGGAQQRHGSTATAAGDRLRRRDAAKPPLPSTRKRLPEATRWACATGGAYLFFEGRNERNTVFFGHNEKTELTPPV